MVELFLIKNPKIGFIQPKKQINLLLKNFIWQNSVNWFLLKLKYFWWILFQHKII